MCMIQLLFIRITITGCHGVQTRRGSVDTKSTWKDARTFNSRGCFEWSFVHTSKIKHLIFFMYQIAVLSKYIFSYVIFFCRISLEIRWMELHMSDWEQEQRELHKIIGITHFVVQILFLNSYTYSYIVIGSALLEIREELESELQKQYDSFGRAIERSFTTMAQSPRIGALHNQLETNYHLCYSLELISRLCWLHLCNFLKPLCTMLIYRFR